MNKKFSTLAVGLLLAGGLFSTAEAQTAVAGLSNATDGGYYSIKFNTVHPTVVGNWHMIVDDDDQLVLDQVQTGSPKDASGYWKISKVNVNGAAGFTFVNADGVKLTFDDNGNFVADGNGVYYAFDIIDGKLTVVGASDKQITYTAAGQPLTLTSTGTNAAAWTIATYPATVADLKEQLGDGFTVTIGKQKKNSDNKLVWDGAYSELNGNVFTGKLIPVGDDGATEFALKNEAGKYIVLTSSTWGSLSNDLQATGDAKAGFKFAAMSQNEINNATEAGTIKTTKFSVTVPNMVTGEPVEIKAKGGYELKVAIVDGKAYLTTAKANKEPQSYLVGEASYTYATNRAETTVVNNTYVKFGDANDVDYAIFNDALWNISRTDANGTTLVAGPACPAAGAEYSGWVPAAQVATAYPEGQWLWNGSKFVNRESGAKAEIDGLRKTDKELTFTANGYTYTFVNAGTPGNTNYGYLNGTEDDFLKEAFYIGTPVKATDDTVYLAKANNGALYLTLDKAAAVEFRLAAAEKASHFTQYATSGTKIVADTLNLVTYQLAEAATGAALSYDKTNQIFTLGGTAYRKNLIFKNKAEGLYNMVQGLTITTATAPATLDTWNDFCSAKKLYGAHNTAELKQADKAYAYVANDLFILEKVDAGQHVSGIEGKNIKIMRNADNNYVLYESGSLLSDANNEAVAGFLAIQNFLDPAYAEKNAALYVDTAAGMNTWRPEYMLVLDPKVVPAGKWCPIHGDDPTCPDAHKVETRGYVEGRYLVNLVDSAANRADCVFQNFAGINYYRLGFVQAKHIGDTLAIASTGDSLNLTGNDFDKMNVAEFAFHYTDANRDAFTIETAYNTRVANENDVLNGDADNIGEFISSKRGYVKFHNGIPVVTPVKAEAEVFVLAETEEDPTANEAVAAAEVSVVAVNGAIIVKGAAGKVVTVANILGQTIANQVAASDNVTIAAPAGIAVVTVDGEATKVVVK